MRGFVEALEAIEQNLPDGVEASHDDFVNYWNLKLDSIIRNAQVSKQTQTLDEPRQISPKGMSPSK